MGGVFNPEGWQRVAGGRSGAETPGRQSQGSAHPEGMPEFCDPSGVVWRVLDQPTGGVAALDPRLLSGKPPACVGQVFKAEPACTGRRGQVMFSFRTRWRRASEPDRWAPWVPQGVDKCSRKATVTGCLKFVKPSSSLNGSTACATFKRGRASKQGSNGSRGETLEMLSQLAKAFRNCELTTVPVIGCISSGGDRR